MNEGTDLVGLGRDQGRDPSLVAEVETHCCVAYAHTCSSCIIV